MSGIQIIDDICLPAPPSFYRQTNSTSITTNLSIVRYDENGYEENGHDIIEYYDELGLPQEDSQNASGYALSITSSPLFDIEYLDEEHLKEFEEIINKMERSEDIYDSGVVSDDVSDQSDAGDTTLIRGEAVIRIERLTESFIKEMTERFKHSSDAPATQPGKEEATQNEEEEATLPEEEEESTPPKKEEEATSPEEKKEDTSPEEEATASQDEDEGFQGLFVTGEQSLHDEDVEMHIIFDNVNDFDGPEVVIGDGMITPNIVEPNEPLTIFNYMNDSFQPKVTLSPLPIEYTKLNVSSEHPPKHKQVSRSRT